MKKCLVLAALLTVTTAAQAAREDWYAYWAIGAAEHDYPGNLGAALDQLAADPNVERVTGGIDMLGFYWPTSINGITGVVVSGSFDSFTGPGLDAQVNQYLYAISNMTFFGREIGDGLYLRAEVGMAAITVTDRFDIVTSETGYGYLLGVGYGIPVSEESRILLNMNFSDKQVGGDSWRSVTFNVGGLW